MNLHLRLWLGRHPRSLGRQGLSLLLWSMGRLSLELQQQRRLRLMLWRLRLMRWGLLLLLLSLLLLLGLLLLSLLLLLGLLGLGMLWGLLGLLLLSLMLLLGLLLVGLLIQGLPSLNIMRLLQGMLLLSLKNLLLGLLSQGLLSLNSLGLLMLSMLLSQGLLSQGLLMSQGLLITGLLLLSQGMHIMLNMFQGGLSGLRLLLSLMICQDCNLIMALRSCDGLLNMSIMMRQGLSLIMLIQRLHIRRTTRCMFALELKERVSGRLCIS